MRVHSTGETMANLNSFQSAKKYVADKKRTGRLVEEVLNKAYQNRVQLQEIWDDLLILCRLIRSWSRKDYRRIPWKSLIMALGAVIYFLNPIDLAPDMIPGIGYVDDISIIAFVLNSIQADLQLFLEWETRRDDLS